MTDYTEIYRSKTGRLEEALTPESFITDAKPQIYPDDLLFIRGLDNVTFRENIPFKDTYFVIDIGHTHLPGIGVSLMNQGIDVSYFLPKQSHPRIQKTISFYADKQKIAKDNLREILGYATLIDCHRASILKEYPFYFLDDKVLPNPDKLRELGIKRVVYLDESCIDRERYNKIMREFRNRFIEYKDAGFEIKFHGIDMREHSKDNYLPNQNGELFISEREITDMVECRDLERFKDIVLSISYDEIIKNFESRKK